MLENCHYPDRQWISIVLLLIFSRRALITRSLRANSISTHSSASPKHAEITRRLIYPFRDPPAGDYPLPRSPAETSQIAINSADSHDGHRYVSPRPVTLVTRRARAQTRPFDFPSEISDVPLPPPFPCAARFLGFLEHLDSGITTAFFPLATLNFTCNTISLETSAGVIKVLNSSNLPEIFRRWSARETFDPGIH